MKIIKITLLLIVFSSTSVYAKNASETAKDYFNRLKKKDYNGAASYFDPNALNEFRQMLSFINEIPAEGQKGFLEAFFGAGATKESVSKLSNSDFFSSFLKAVMSQAEAAGGINFDGMEVLGEVLEGSNISHVVTRNRVSMGEIEMEAMEVVSFKKNGKEWKALLSGKMKGMARQLRAVIKQQQ
ncbi:MAG: hypothetical protein OEV42_11645 [Deltaproteobacteria bacterium]|nr:hypothetical protein [Deltaproteobacteria bacterium]